jgi:diadenosine tetraphosphatase ApaH/serine/threonine PP2A family protein phosphatase
VPLCSGAGSDSPTADQAPVPASDGSPPLAPPADSTVPVPLPDADSFVVPGSAAAAVLALFAPLWSADSDVAFAALVAPSIPAALVRALTAESIAALSTAPVLLALSAPLVVVGDIHGSLADLLRILQLFGAPPATRYLFLGDYVDRGPDSTSVICVILALVVAHPAHVFVLRGNHEFSHINRVYGFLAEIRRKYGDDELWEGFQGVFSWMPLAAVIGRAVFCVHGGLSPALADVTALEKLTLPIVTYLTSPMIADLVWSDPADGITGFRANPRGSGRLFGPNTVEAFLRANGLKFLLRAHQTVPVGWRPFANMNGVTIFSSSNYCQVSQNKCGVVHLRDDKELAFFTLDTDGEMRSVPSLWTLPIDGDIGLKRILRAASRPDINAAADIDDEDLVGAGRMRRSGSMSSALDEIA